LRGKSIYRWVLMGFWADLGGRFDSWSVDLNIGNYWKNRRSKFFTENRNLMEDYVSVHKFF
jgi:hypothetical protein